MINKKHKNNNLKYHLVIFKNDNEKKFHIQSTKVKNPEVSCTLKTQKSRSLYAISGKDSAQCACTTSFLRTMLVTDLNDWDRQIIPLGNVNASDLNYHYWKYANELLDLNYEQVTRAPHVRHYELVKKYNSTFLKRIVTNMNKSQCIEQSKKILKDFKVTENIETKCEEIYKYVLVKKDSPIDNMSQFVRHILLTYTDYKDEREIA
tara:strand:- start:45 stop:662 length:618 start_codon:yes stop_codon:yes gene_type:complete